MDVWVQCPCSMPCHDLSLLIVQSLVWSSASELFLCRRLRGNNTDQNQSLAAALYHPDISKYKRVKHNKKRASKQDNVCWLELRHFAAER